MNHGITLLPIGGLANRMRAIASAAALAERVDRPLEILWTVNDELKASFGELFRLLPSHITLRDISDAEAIWRYHPPRKRNLYLSPLLRPARFRAVYTDDDILTPERAESAAKAIADTRGDALLRAYSFFYPVDADSYRALFVPRDDIRREADTLLQRLGPDATGLHIRRTDNTVSIENSPLEAFTALAEEELASYPERRIYLATDDNSVKDLFVHRFGDRVLTTAPAADRRSAAGMRHALTEMLTLAGCARIVGSYYSSYSEAAALLGNTLLRQIREPRR